MSIVSTFVLVFFRKDTSLLTRLKTKALVVSFCLFASLTQTISLHAATPQEQALLDLTNEERKASHLKPLKFNTKLTSAARKQSNVMAKNQTLSHEVNGKKLIWRVKKSGYRYKNIAENIAYLGSNVKTDKSKTVMKMWMDSQGHRRNILDKNFTEIGIGIAYAPNGDIYYTLIFGKR